MKTGVTIVSVLMALSMLCFPLEAGTGRGGGSGTGGQGMRGSGGGYGGEKRDMMEQERGRYRTMETKQQRERLRDCTESAKRLHARTQEMTKHLSGGFNAVEARQIQFRLREEMQTMERDHERLMNSIGENPSEGIRSRMQSMNEARDRVRTRLQEMDDEFSKDSPSRERLVTQAREMEHATNQWRYHYREMAEEMDKE